MLTVSGLAYPYPALLSEGKLRIGRGYCKKRLPSRQPYLHTSIFQLFDNENIVKIEAVLTGHFEIVVKAFLNTNLHNSVSSNVLDYE